jgi:hypothetical protein
VLGGCGLDRAEVRAQRALGRVGPAVLPASAFLRACLCQTGAFYPDYAVAQSLVQAGLKAGLRDGVSLGLSRGESPLTGRGSREGAIGSGDPGRAIRDEPSRESGGLRKHFRRQRRPLDQTGTS